MITFGNGRHGSFGTLFEIHIDLRSEERSQRRCPEPNWSIKMTEGDRDLESRLYVAQPARPTVLLSLCLPRWSTPDGFRTPLYGSTGQDLQLRQLTSSSLSSKVYRTDVGQRLWRRSPEGYCHASSLTISVPSPSPSPTVSCRRTPRPAMWSAVSPPCRPLRYTFPDSMKRSISSFPFLIETMGDAYPELVAQKTLIENVIKEEEESFQHTDTGIRLLDKKMEELKEKNERYSVAPTPLPLWRYLRIPARPHRNWSSANTAWMSTQGVDVEQKSRRNVPATPQPSRLATGLRWKPARRSSWVTTSSNATPKSSVTARSNRRTKCSIRSCSTRLRSAEMGGQVGDTGWFFDDEKVEVIDTKRENNLPVHILTHLPKDVTVSLRRRSTENAVSPSNATIRLRTRCTHAAPARSARHHVEQKGSYVSPDSPRFDFSHFRKVSDEELRKVEEIVGQKIRADYPPRNAATCRSQQPRR